MTVLLSILLTFTFPGLLDALDLTFNNAKDSIDSITLSVEKLITPSSIRLLRFRVVEEAIDVLEPSFRHVLKKIESDDCIYLMVYVLPLSFLKDSSEVIFSQYGCDDFFRHHIASGVARLLRDQGILTKTIASN